MLVIEFFFKISIIAFLILKEEGVDSMPPQQQKEKSLS